MAVEPRSDPTAQPERPVLLDRSEALLRIAAVVSGQQDLARLFEDVIDESFSLFGVDQAGLWMYRDGPQPLTLAAQRGLSPDILALVETLPRDATTSGMTAIREQRVQVMDGDLSSTLPDLREIYLGAGIRTICFVPIVFGGESLGLLVLYHHHAVPVDPGRDGPGSGLRRPHGDGHRQRPAGRIHADVGRPPALDLRPGPAPEPDPRRAAASVAPSSPRRADSSTTTPSASIASTMSPARASRSPSRARSRARNTRPPPRSGSGSARA